MQRHTRRVAIVVIVAAGLATACSKAQPSLATNSLATMRLSPVGVTATANLDLSRAVDRDSTTTVPVSVTATVTLRFARAVEVRRMKAHGAGVRITGAGMAFAAEGSGWTSAAPAAPFLTDVLTVTLEPGAPGAHLDEIEVWGAGLPAAPRGGTALALATRDAKTSPFENAIIDRADGMPATLSPAGLNQGSSCTRARFSTSAPIRQVRRAYLAYEANVQRPAVLRRSVDEGAPVGGLWLAATDRVRTITDELDPERLTGSDSVLLCLPDEATGQVTVDGLRLVLVTDDGLDVFDRETHLAWPEATDGDAATTQLVHDTRVEAGLDRRLAVDGASVTVSTTPARLTSFGAFDGQAWSDQGPLAIDEARTSLPLEAPAAQAAQVTFAGSARTDVPAAGLSEFSLAGSGTGPRVGGPRIVLTSPALRIEKGRWIGERFDGKAYIAGWAESPMGAGVVTVDDVDVGTEGTFGTRVTRPAGASGAWDVVVRARFPGGAEVSRTLHLEDDGQQDILNDSSEPTASLPADRRFGAEGQEAWGSADAAHGGHISLGSDVFIDIPAGAVAAKTAIGITRKGPEVIPQLEAGMINVTAPANSAFRFLPKGQKFAVPAQITLPYDPDLLPEGVLPEEIRTYYFDEAQDRWIALPRRQVVRSTQRVVSETTHFTFMINAVLVLPDHPGPTSFNPNSIKDLKAADPSAGIDLIEPPTGNSQGTARVSFPIRLPKARGGYQPSIGLSYDSAAGEGWAGIGWSVPVSSISIDAKYGVPSYDGFERYLLDGEQLVPMDGAGPCSDQTPGQRFAARVERAFRRVVRCGANPTSYWFEVTDKSGVLFVYGKHLEARLASYIPRVTVPPRSSPIFDVAEWYLERVVDTNGNLTELGYELDHRDRDDGVYNEDFRQMYLRDVWYTGYANRGDQALEGGDPGVYHVRLSHELAGIYPATRTDVITSGRLGFKTMLRRRLGSVLVELTKGPDKGVIREYKLSYEQGDFGKSRLKAIAVFGTGGAGAGKLFYSHSFEWENASDHAAQAFSSPVAWSLPSTDSRGIGSTDSVSGGFHVFGGFGLAPTKNVASLGFRIGIGYRHGETKAAMADVNGDGLPDRIAEGDVPWFNQAVPGSSGGFRGFSPLSPPGDPYGGMSRAPAFGSFPGLGSEEGATIDAAVQIQALDVLSVNLGASYNLTKSRSFLVDANGDGLLDVVQNGVVYLNRPRCGSNATCVDPGGFQFEPAWVVSDLGESQAKIDQDPALQKMAARADEALSPEDVVLQWNAPYAGTIDLVASLAWANAPEVGGRHDGVRLRLYRAGSTQPLQTWVKTPDDATATAVSLKDVPGNTTSGFPVGSGDVFFFVLSTLADNTLDKPYPPEEVSFAPVITYATVDAGFGTAAPDKSLADSVGTPAFLFDSKSDLRLAGEPRGAISTGRPGTITLRSHIAKMISADDVRMCVHVVPAPKSGQSAPKPPEHCPAKANPQTPIAFGYSAADSTTVDRTDTLELATGDVLYFQEETDLSIDPKTAAWRVDAEMTCPRNPSGACVQVTPREQSFLKFAVVPYLHLHQPVLWTAETYQPDPVPPTPYEVDAATHPRTTLYVTTVSTGGGIPATLGARRDGGELLFKESSPAPGETRITVHPITVDPGDRIYLEVFSATPFDGTWAAGVSSADPVASGACDTTFGCIYFDLTAPLRFVVDQPDQAWLRGGAPILPGGYHAWRYGLWQGKPDQPFEFKYFGTPDRDELNSWNGSSAGDVLNSKKGGFQDPNGEYRKRIQLVGILVPSAQGTRSSDGPGLRPDAGGSGLPSFVSPDRTAFVTADGTMNASRRSLQTTGTASAVPGAGDAASGAFSIANLSRSSVGVGINAGVSVIGLGVSLGAGLNQQKTDVLDMNGDRIVDTLAAGGVPDLSDISVGDLAGFIADPVKALWSTDARITDAHSLGTKRTVNFTGLPRLNLDVSGQVGLNVSDTVKYMAKRAGYDVIASALPGAGIGFDLSTSVNDLQDVNGDGLPDMVRRDFSGACKGFLVRLNLGTSFARNEDCVPVPTWGAGGPKDDAIIKTLGNVGGDFAGDFLSKIAGKQALRKQTTVTVSANVAGMIVAGESYGASLSMDSSLNATNIELVDVTGDGLPDYVFRDNAGGAFKVMVNLGYGFAAPVPYAVGKDWPGAYTDMKAARLRTSTDAGQWVLDAFLPQARDGIDPISATGTHTVVPTFGGTFTFSWPLLLFAPPFIYIGGGGGDLSLQRMGGFELGLMDIDGDGFVDHVLKTGENGLVLVRLNQLAGGNLLKSVKRPLGGSFDVHYARTGNTVDMPESRWVVDRVTARDGRTDVSATEPGHVFVTTYGYQGGKHDRYERDFLGFASVVRTNPDQSTVAQAFLNADFRVKGMLVSERLEDADHRPWTETVNTYGTEVKKAGAADCLDHGPFFIASDDYCTSFFEPLFQTETRFFEGKPVAGIVTRQTFDVYDDFGNVKTFHDWGDVADPADDVVATIDYDTSSLAGLYFMDRPTHVAVKDGSGTTLRDRTGHYDPVNGNLTQLDAQIGDGTTATTKLTWKGKGDPALGALESVTNPPNLPGNGESSSVTYDYGESVTGTYPTRIEDAQHYFSTAAYDERYGEAKTTSDVNHQVTERRFDDFGRLKVVAGPKDTLDQPTIAIEYAPAAAVPYAVTTNKLPGTAGVRTVILMDAIQRVIQTKKTAEVSPQGNEVTVFGWSVTGHQQFDAMGRVALKGQTFFQAGASPYFARGTPRNPTGFTYDVLGRSTQVVEPNGATTRTEYGFGVATTSPVVRFKTTTTDALGKAKIAYRDGGQRTVGVEEHIDGRSPVTAYLYDAVGQLRTITDAAGNLTSMIYDGLGRRTSLTNPDAGSVAYTYDRAGHVVTRKDAKDQTITYEYRYDQLSAIHYPDSRRDVSYLHGPPSAWTSTEGRSAGRVRSVTDAAGNELRAYDELGALASTTRNLRPLRPGDRWRSFSTAFAFDSFGRMLSMVYPDGEVLTYGYDAGGLVKSATGSRAATRWAPRQSETYLQTLTYDEFGQRVYMRLGNGVVTSYTYEPPTRRLHTLTTNTPLSRTLQAITYQYDLVGNVAGLVNALGAPIGDQSGWVSFAYRYDDLYRLTSAHGEAASRPHTIDRFTSTFAYSDIHNMSSNVQVHEIVHGDGKGIDTPPKTNHAWSYEYGGNGPHQATRVGDTFLSHDANGNTTRECRTQTNDPSCQTTADHLRRLIWTEENRLDAVIDGGGQNVTSFVYDAAGERIVKLGRNGESVTIGQFWALKGRRAGTKHIFAGATRLASKLLPPPGWDDTPVGSLTDLTAVTVTTTLATDTSGCDPSNYQPQKCPVLPGGDPVLNRRYDGTRVRPATYYYHSDHLGSTSWATDQNARVHEHVEYFPYGSVWRDPRSDADGSPVRGQRFLFTSKEADEETGLHYFGLRYYDPGRALWTTRDNRLDGLFDPRALNLYAYTGHNPIRYSDPDGGFKIEGGGAIHEAIARAAAGDAGVKYTKQLDQGVAWPDVPMGYAGTWRNLHTPGTLANRSHYGDLQFWHSMASGSEKSNGEVLDKIVKQAREWWSDASKGSDLDMGKLLHTVQDSFSDSHVARDKSGAILFFENYGEQDADKHGTADKGSDWKTIPGAQEAYKASSQLLKMRKENADFGEVEKYLRGTVYRFAPGAADKPVGGSLQQYRPDPPQAPEMEYYP
jgi:RHS repeat-associated protein